MLFRNKAKAIDALPLVGNTLTLPNGGYLQTPNQRIIKLLRATDKRLHYYPIATEAIQQQTGRFVFYKGTEGLGQQIVKDLSFSPRGLTMRGLTLSLRGRFPHYTRDEAEHDLSKWGWGVDPDEHVEMSDISTVLQTGTDRKGYLGHTGGMNLDSEGRPEVNYRSHEWMYQHWENESAQCVDEGHPEDANRLFPSLLVYDANALSRGDDEKIRPEALLAVYVMDRVVEDHHLFAGALGLSASLSK